MKLTKFLSAIVLGIVLISCSNDDDGPAPLGISFENDMYDAAFYMEGQTGAVSIMPSDASGVVISLAEGTDASISYNEATGTVEWTKLLPLGETVVTVMAQTDTEDAMVEVTLNNLFQGSFDGGYNIDPMSQILTSLSFEPNFSSDGTLTLNDGANPGTGTWTLDGNDLQFVYSYDADPATFYTFAGTIFYDDVDAYLSGLWYEGAEVDPGMERGYFRVDLNQ